MTRDAFGRHIGRPQSSYAAMVRERCNECGSGSLQWGRAADLAFEVDPAQRLRVFELVGFVGHDADAWRCLSCGNFGAFGPDEWWFE